MRNLRKAIGIGIWSAAASAMIGMTTALLSLMFTAGGDEVAATAVKGVGIVALTVFGLSIVALVLLLAILELLRPDSTE